MVDALCLSAVALVAASYMKFETVSGYPVLKCSTLDWSEKHVEENDIVDCVLVVSYFVKAFCASVHNLLAQLIA